MFMQQSSLQQMQDTAHAQAGGTSVVSGEQYSFVSLQELCEITRLPESMILALYELGVFKGLNLSEIHNDYYFESNAHILIMRYVQGHGEYFQNPASQDIHQLKNSKQRDSASFNSEADVTLKKITSVKFLAGLLKSGKRRHLVKQSICKGLNLEVSAKVNHLVVKVKQRAKSHRIVLMSWDAGKSLEICRLDRAIEQFLTVKDKLNRMPSQQEFRFHSKKPTTIGDVLNAHLEFNIKLNHGEGSAEWNLIKGLIKNHLSKPVSVVHSSGCAESMIFIDQSLNSMTKAKFKSYLKSFKENHGTHDKIVTRVKAAMNFSINERIIVANDFFPFYEIPRINKARHVEISDCDVGIISDYLNSSQDEDFKFFMELQSSGHFRTSQVMSTRVRDWDFEHSLVSVKPKSGNSDIIEIAIPTVLAKKVHARATALKEKYGDVDYLFPSNSSKSTHRANFNSQWTKLRFDLGFAKVCPSTSKVSFKYRLHDYRETLLGRSVSDDDQANSRLLGQKSEHSAKHYRLAKKSIVRNLTEKSYTELTKIRERAPDSSLHL
tara:strand:+ start:3949 stop:5595 length:1647 start_codon:yes stop_codon:yes gene_type:complete